MVREMIAKGTELSRGMQDRETSDEQSRHWQRWLPRGAAPWAIATWLLGIPSGVSVVTLLDPNPFTARGALLPVAIGILGGGILLGLAIRRSSDTLVGIAAGGYAAWVGITLAVGYNGTPFGDSGMRGDSARLAAMATRFSTTWAPVDGLVPSVPSEYPPLFPWLLGHISNVVEEPAWSLISHGEVLLISAAVLLAFLLWNGLVRPPIALVLAVIPPWVFGQPRKSYEIITLAVYLPWVLRTFGGRPRSHGGFHWLVGGAIGGLLIQTYQGYLLFSALGLAALITMIWWNAEDRGKYLRHVVGVAITAFIVASWYLIPYLYGVLAIGGSRVNDYFVSPSIVDQPLGLDLVSAPLASLSTLLEVVGLFGLIWYLRSQWWARPLLALVVGTYLYRWVMVLIFVQSGHTLYLHYTSHLIRTALISAGVLAVVTAVPVIIQRLSIRSVREIGVLAAAGVVISAALGGLRLWMPWPTGIVDVDRGDVAASANLVTYAHAEPLPDGSLPRHRPPGVTVRWFPVEPVEQVVEDELGDGARPVTLSIDERLFAYLPWKAYVPVHRLAANTFVHYDERVSELRRLADIRNPAEFTRASLDTRYGRIDVFVLRLRAAGWAWGNIVFQPNQFDGTYWHVDDSLPEDVVVAVRRSADG